MLGIFKLKFYFYFRSARFQSTKLLVGCPQASKGRDLICMNGDCVNPDQKCVVSSVIEIWHKAGFGKFIIKGATIAENVVKLHRKYTKLKQLKTLNWDSSRENFTQLQNDFVEESYKLFDISVSNTQAGL